MNVENLAMQVGQDRIVTGFMFSIIFAWLVVLSARSRG